MIIDLTTLNNEEAAAKITAALAEAYFDNVLDSRVDIKPLSKAYGIAFDLCPNYRVILMNKPGYEKFRHLDKEMATITSLPIKPQVPCLDNKTGDI